MSASWMKWFGIGDGIAVAALMQLASDYPPAAAWALPAAKVLGVVGTILGASHVMASKTPTP